MSQTITIDPVTRLEGHGKITIQLNGQGEVEDAHFHVTQVRGFEKFCRRPAVLRDAQPDGAHLRHLPGLAPDRLGQGLRSHHVGAHSAHRRAAAAHAEPGADGAVARAELLLSLLARSAAGHGVRSRKRATSSAWSAAKPELGRAGVGAAPLRPAHHRTARQQAHSSRLGGSRRRHRAAAPGQARRDSGHDSRGLRQHRPGAGRLQADRRQLQAGDRGLRQLPVQLPEPDQRRRVDRVHRRRAAADRSQGQHHRGRHHRQPLHRSHRRGGRALQLHQVRLLQAARLSRGQLSRGPAGAAQHRQDHGHAAGRQGTGRVQAAGRRARSRAPSTTITRGSSRCSTASRRSSRSSPIR